MAHTATGGRDPDESSAPVQLDPSVVAGIHELSQVRDICIAREPHVVVAASRNEYFIDPSHTDRLRFNASQADDLTPLPHGVTVRTLKKSSDADAMNRVLQWNGSLNRSELEVQFLEAPEQKGAVPLEPTIVCRTVLGL